jgi:phosphomevalonate kinase
MSNLREQYSVLQVKICFLHIHSQILSGKRLSAKQVDLHEVTYYVNRVRRSLFKIPVEHYFSGIE